MLNILITGGAGYIGSHVVKQLLETTNHQIVIVDNLSTGSQTTIDKLFEIAKKLDKTSKLVFINADLKNFKDIKIIFQTDPFHPSENKPFDVLIHFAASIVVPESVENPTKYYMNNTVNTTHLIKCANDYGVKKMIFSSTAAVYGEPTNLNISQIDETYPPNPINPYGYSKLMSEIVLKDTANANENLKYVIFRYFNVAGADIYYENNKLKPRIGQSFPNATHLIKIASECATNKREKMSIFGDDFNTHDGTGVRDYIHIDDLASAHIEAIKYLDTNQSDTFNLGYGKGFSVKEVIETMKNVTNKNFKVDITQKRAGDPAMLIANNSKILSKMNWKPKYNDLGLICESAYLWEMGL
jgi:UDP-glucose 4-epimerase